MLSHIQDWEGGDKTADFRTTLKYCKDHNSSTNGGSDDIIKSLYNRSPRTDTGKMTFLYTNTPQPRFTQSYPHQRRDKIEQC